MIEAVVFILILTALLFIILSLAVEADDETEDFTREGRD